ncbi:MAG: tetratricopeptide repeat protein [Pirellulales bacterium]|nr:tetratricopeptide repeat protein [Pirellulales bacterium]
MMLTACWIFAGVLGLLAASSLPAGQPEDQFAVAAGHYEAQRWDLAAEEFQTFLQQFPEHPQAAAAVFFRGEALMQKGDNEAAGALFAEYLRREPEGRFARSALFRRGEAAYLAGRPEDARPFLRQFLEKYPQDRLTAYVLPYLGEIALKKDELAAAEAFFRQSLDRFPDGRLQDDSRLGLARSLEKQQKFDQAGQDYAALAGKTASALADDAQFHLGTLHYTRGNYAQAVETFQQLETKWPASPWIPNARLGRGWSLIKLNRLDEAASLFTELAGDKKTGAEARRWLDQVQRMRARAYLAQKDYDRAAALLESITLAPGESPGAKDSGATTTRGVVPGLSSSEGGTVGQANRGTLGEAEAERHYLLAVAYERQKKYEPALAQAAAAAESASGALKADAQLLQGSLLVALKKYAAAVPPLEAYLSRQPTGDPAVQALGELAICCARTGRLDRAKKLYAELREKYPQHRLLPPAVEQLAEAAYDARDTAWSAELSAWLADWAKNHPEQAAAPGGPPADYEIRGLTGLGWSQFKSGRLAEAEGTFARVLEKNPPEPLAAEAAFVRGQILEKLGRADPALAMYDQVISRHPKSPQHAEALLAAARLRVKLQQFAPAVVLYQRFIEEHPRDARRDAALYERAWALMDQKQPAEARKAFEQLKTEFPKTRFGHDAAYRLAQMDYEAGNYAQAERLLGELLSAGPEPQLRQYALYLQGQIAAAGKDWDQIRRTFTAFANEYPQSSLRGLADFWIAEADYRQKNYEAAERRLADLDRRLGDRREPWTAVVALRRAQVLAQRGAWDEALLIVLQIEPQFPDFPQQYEADYLIGRCRAARAEFDEARQAYLKAIRSAQGAKTETAAMAQWMIGESYFHQKHYQTALREYLRVEILYAYPTWQAAALLQAGKCHELLGNRREAEKLYARILEKYSKTPFADQAQQRLGTAHAPSAGNSR